MLWECKISSSTKYLWCYVDSDMPSWETCGCKLRQDFINYWGMLRRELVKPKPKPLKVSGSPLTPRKNALVLAMTSVAIIMGLLLMALAFQITKMKSQQPQLFGLYQALNGNAPNEQWIFVSYQWPLGHFWKFCFWLVYTANLFTAKTAGFHCVRFLTVVSLHFLQSSR